jgi:dihydrofolate reductase
MYQTMRYWETAHTVANRRSVSLDFARIWQAADKIVYSTTLQTPDTDRTRIDSEFDPVQVRKLKEAADRDLTVGGARLAAQAIAAKLVDEYQPFVVAVVVGTRALPDQVRFDLALAEERRFGSGTVYLRYRPRSSGGPEAVMESASPEQAMIRNMFGTSCTKRSWPRCGRPAQRQEMPRSQMRPPEPCTQVRILLGAQLAKRIRTVHRFRAWLSATL